LREIVLDTETTGLDPFDGHRMIEIGCIELVNRIPSGQSFHSYLNPERDVPAEALAVHGLDAAFLKDKPRFVEIAADLLAFIGDAPLVAHNAIFDLGFLNAELERAGQMLLARERLTDTLLLARRKYPAGPNRLDDLCARYGIDNSRRTKHGALLDAEILAEVYIELIDARQAELILVDATAVGPGVHIGHSAIRVRPTVLAPRLTAHELAAHDAFVATLGADAIWREYLQPDAPATRPVSASDLSAAAMLARQAQAAV
jgi:DNA polymerase-3 subunit epsilon